LRPNIAFIWVTPQVGVCLSDHPSIARLCGHSKRKCALGTKKVVPVSYWVCDINALAGNN
jgi:hypothetical protein